MYPLSLAARTPPPPPSPPLPHHRPSPPTPPQTCLPKRVWCLCEIHEAVACTKKPLVIACGQAVVRAEESSGGGGGSHRFVSSLAHLYNMQYFADVESAEASVAADRDRILDEVRQDPGFEKLNRIVRGAICGSIVSSRCPPVVSAVLGMPEEFHKLCDTLVDGRRGEETLSTAARVELLAAATTVAAAGGYQDIIERLMEVVQRAAAQHRAAAKAGEVEAEAEAGEVEAEAGEADSAESTANCPGRHGLVQSSALPQSMIGCAGCGSRVAANANATLHSCRKCDYDLCARCFTSGLSPSSSSSSSSSSPSPSDSQGDGEEDSQLHLMTPDHNGMSSLHHVSYAGHTSTLEFMLQRLDDNTLREALKPDGNGRNPLMYATESNFEEIAIRLIDRADTLGMKKELCTYSGGGGTAGVQTTHP